MYFDFALNSPTIWVFFALVLFLLVLGYFGIHKKIAGSLDARADKIRAELDEARSLREEAQALLASYQRKQKEAEEQADSIVKQARHDAEIMATNARKDLAERLERRAEQAEAKIATAEAQAMAEVKAKAAEMALNAAEKLIRSGTTSEDHAKLVKDGIAQMGKVLN
ncbi:F0F1 ATP synthase subunit B family protein [Hellea balneolensis]|uniref:F0F1 ATP synthase subunit B family protein n=1 Tax=Hellea balneolensis TaxID=287478 RepID=UPI0003FFBBFA|nr:ATP synthase subunit B [Hellea balneolensis]